MQLSMKPYVTVGVALVGASVIAIAPIAPRADLHMPAVNLMASSIENPITVFKPVVNATGDLIKQALQNEFANPFPILRQVFANQQFTVEQLLLAIKDGGSAIGDLVGGLPAALNAAGAILRTGNVNGAIDSLVSSGLLPILGLIQGVSTPLMAVLERPFAVGQELVGAVIEAGLQLTILTAVSFLGLGFSSPDDLPILQRLVATTESVLKSIATLNPINVINAIQNGIADVLLTVVAKVNTAVTFSLPYIRDLFVTALKAGQPVEPEARVASVATAPTTDATTVNITLPGADSLGAAPVVTPIGSSDEAATVEPDAEVPAAVEPVAEETVAEEPVVEEPVVGEPAVEQPAAETPAAETETETGTGTETEIDTKDDTDSEDAEPKSGGKADRADKADRAESSAKKRESDSSRSSNRSTAGSRSDSSDSGSRAAA